ALDAEADPEDEEPAASEEETDATARDVLLVTTDASGMSEKLAEGFAGKEVEVLTVDGTIAAIGTALDALAEEGRGVRAVVHTLSLDHPDAATLDLEKLNAAQDSGVRFAHALVKSLTAREWSGKPRVFFLTRGTMPVVPGEPLPGLASAPLTGLLRVANNEHPDFRWTQIDLDPRAGDDPRAGAFEIEDVVAEILLV